VAVEVYLAARPRSPRHAAHPGFVRASHPIVRAAGAEKSRYLAQALALSVHHRHADQIGLVELVRSGLGQILAPQRHLGSAERSGLLRIVASLEARRQVGAVHAALRHCDLTELPRLADPPRGVFAEVTAP